MLTYDAFSLLVPDIFLDTMGYAFSLAFSKLLFPTMPTGAYVHYPTISTDMLESLSAKEGNGLNAGAGKGWKGKLKRQYWLMFAWMYGWVGSHVDVVMTNSSWTQAHIRALWGPMRARRRKAWEIEVLFPPVAVAELEEAVEVSESSEAQREPILLYVAQFRPEKNQALILRAFSQLVQSSLGGDENNRERAKLVLLGSVRDREDATRVYELRLLAHELKIKEKVEFICDASWPEILKWLRKSWVGVNGMWNEHFGIGVVEYQAAGLICVVNNSGGPKDDIVVEYDGGPTGACASKWVAY
jgi:alpha-1,2-mannosyltransferase